MFYATTKNQTQNPRNNNKIHTRHQSQKKINKKTCTTKVTSVVKLKEKKRTKSPVDVTFNWHVNINYYDITSLVLQQVMAPNTE